MNTFTKTYIPILLLIFSIKISYAQEKTTIQAVQFNTEKSEYAPVYYKDGIVFCGTNRTNEALTYLDDKTGEQLTDIYFINPSKNKISLFSKTFKTNYHDGPISFTADGKTAYFSRNQQVNKKLKNSAISNNTLGIYKATYDGEKWTNITPCSFNSSAHNVAQPSISADGKKLFVVSDKKGLGGKDIYYCDVTDGKCGPLISLNINTTANETFPYIDRKNTLYFSSNQPNGYGGLDIYSAQFIDNKFASATLLDSTINSSSDDFGIAFKTDGTEGYFTSNRMGSDDIFKIKISPPEFNDCIPIEKEELCFEFFEEATVNADSVSMLYEWDFGDGTKEQTLETYHCYKEPGFYIVELNIMDPNINKVFVNEASYELEIAAVNQPKIECENNAIINQPFKVDVSQGNWTDYQIIDYYIRYDDSTYTKNNNSPHHYTIAGNYELNILITGLDKESQEIRTNCFYKTIEVKESTDSLSTELLFAAQKNGEKLSIDDDAFYTLELTTSDTALSSSDLKGYANTAKEIYNDDEGIYSYVVGSTDNPFDLIEEYRKAHKDGFSDAKVVLYSKEALSLAGIANVYEDTNGVKNFILNNIQFVYDGVNLNNSSKVELNKLVKYLKTNPKIRIEIGAHTDSKGTNEYNLELSQKRADNVATFLVKQGLNKTNIEAVGYGETEPYAPNTLPNGNDNPEGRAKNRRVSFKILN